MTIDLDVRMAKKQRESIPKAIKEAVLKEFNYRCAICSSDRPHLHHIDEIPSNNDPMNLIPLCPNHHLIDQHDASNAIPRAKLSFFRRYKHRHILKPQFNPIFHRMAFLQEIDEVQNVEVLESSATELVNFVRHLAMGEFYGRELEKSLKPWSVGYIQIIGDPAAEAKHEKFQRERDESYRDQLRMSRKGVEKLIVEMLDYQVWPDTKS